jgi:hypothetical protein
MNNFLQTIIPLEAKPNPYFKPQIKTFVVNNENRPTIPTKANSQTINLPRQDLSSVLLQSIIVTSTPINMKDGIVYVPLISGKDLQSLGSTVSTFTQLDSKYKKLLLAQSEVGLTFVSDISRQVIQPFRAEYNVFLINTKDGKYYVTYGKLDNNELFYS